MVIYVGVETLEYLKKGGRITPAAAAIGRFGTQPGTKSICRRQPLGVFLRYFGGHPF